MPVASGPWLKEGCATPAPSKATTPDGTFVASQLLEPVPLKNVNVTFPVGMGPVPVTVALSWTVVPLAIVLLSTTTASVESCISVPVEELSLVTVTASSAHGLVTALLFASPA